MEAPSTTANRKSAKPSTSGRAKVACRRCNIRRIKCDVSQSQPCRNCRVHDVGCEVISSRRGKYPRAHSKRQTSRDFANGEISSLNQVFPAKSVALPATQERNIPSPPETNRQPTSTQSQPQNHAESHVSPIQYNPSSGIDADQNSAPVEEGSEMLFARMAEASPEQAATEPYRDSGRTLYLGEAFSLAFVVKTVCSPSDDMSIQDKVHYPIPLSVDDSARNAFHDRNLGTEELAALRAKGVFNFPPQHVGEKLLRTFFESFHPAFPVFDRREVAASYKKGQLSFLVLHTIFYIAVTVCDEELLYETGFKDRYQARTAYYVRAKALYDCDQERDKVKLTAVLFLLGFWWQGPEDQKDSWHWLGAALSLAQTLGMHRSTAKSGLSPSQQSLWKRIWWSIYVRDRHAAAALGRPFRIHDEDCDVEQLEVLDFDFDEDDLQDILCGIQKSYHKIYAIEMSKLAILLGRVLRSEFSASRPISPHGSELLVQDLRNWEQQMPAELILGQVDGTLGAQFWARMLHASFNNCQILLYRPRCISIESPAAAKRDACAKAAADATTRLVEDLLSANTLRFGQLHLVPALFAALSVHTIVIRRRDTLQSQLAENRSRQCMLALSELSKSWPVGGWILQLFVNLLKRLTGKDFGFQIAGPSSKQTTISNQNSNTALQNGRNQIIETLDKGRVNETGEQIDMDNVQPFVQTQSLDGMLWPYGEELLPSDFLFQDAFNAFPAFNESYIVESSQTGV